MRRHGIPTAKYGNFNSYDEASKHFQVTSFPVVIKALGPAAGKGVVIAEGFTEADETLKHFMLGGKFSSAEESVVIVHRGFLGWRRNKYLNFQ